MAMLAPPPLRDTQPAVLRPELKLPVSLLMHYLFFLTRRPISASNNHYLQQRLEGLQSLCDALQDTDIPSLREGIQLLSAMNPSNFYRLAERLQYTLLPLANATTELPRDFVISDSPPPTNFLA